MHVYNTDSRLSVRCPSAGIWEKTRNDIHDLFAAYGCTSNLLSAEQTVRKKVAAVSTGLAKKFYFLTMSRLYAPSQELS